MKYINFNRINEKHYDVIIKLFYIFQPTTIILRSFYEDNHQTIYKKVLKITHLGRCVCKNVFKLKYG